MSAIIFAPEGRQYLQDTSQQRALGTMMMMEDGRAYRYCRSGATVLVAGNLQQAAAADANMDELVITAAVAVGAKTFIFTAQTPTALVANELAEGYTNVEDDAGEGFLYKIDSNPAIAADTSNYTITLVSGVIVAWTTATTVGIKPHPYRAVIVSPTTITGSVVGVAAIALAASTAAAPRFGWLQVKGPASVTTEGTPVLGHGVRRSETTAGAVTVHDLDEANMNQPVIGECIEVATTVENSVVNLFINGYV